MSISSGAKSTTQRVLVAAVTLGAWPHGASAWDLWRPSKERCGFCGALEIKTLVTTRDATIAAGCLPEMDQAGVDLVPFCRVTSGEGGEFKEQSGGHKGDFFKLEDGSVAKLFTRPLVDMCQNPKSEACRRQEAGLAEYEFYMQLWCISRTHQDDWLAPFVLGTDPFAPNFYGYCRATTADGAPGLYLVMENLFSGYTKASQLDLKIGYSYEPGAITDVGFVKGHLEAMAIDAVTPTAKKQVRLAGYRVWDPKAGANKTMRSKLTSPLVNSDFANLFAKRLSMLGQADAAASALDAFASRTADIARYWFETGRTNVRAISASLLYIWDGEPSADLRPKVKFIDFAHTFAAKDKKDWKNDGVLDGLLTLYEETTIAKRRSLAKSKSLQLGRLDSMSESRVLLGFGGRPKVAKVVKCPRTSDETMIVGQLNLDECRLFYELVGVKYMDWRKAASYLKSSECRVCDRLEPKTSAGTSTKSAASQEARKRRLSRSGSE